MTRLLPLAALLIAAAPAPPGETITIRYRAVPIEPRAISFDVTLSPDGRGVLTWWRGPAAHQRRLLRWSQADARTLARLIAPLRPAGETVMMDRGLQCRAQATDQDTVDVRWTGGPGGPRHLAWYLGCDMDSHQDMLTALSRAERLPPLGRYLKPPY